MKTFIRALTVLAALIYLWGGAYLFDHVLPKGWQYLWYGMPTMMTFMGLGALLIWAVVCAFDN